jgi:phage tail-like protein
MDGPSGVWLGVLASYKGPVAALATDGDDLLVKPGPGDDVIRLSAASACVAGGWIALGPLDAGEQSSWLRCGVDADTPAGSAIAIESYCAASATPAPTPADFTLTPAPELLIDVAAPSDAAPTDPERARFLWLKVNLTSQDAKATPVLRQVRAQTPGEDLMTYLPLLFARTDGSWSDPASAGTPRGFLGRLLALFQSELSGAEVAIDDLSRLLEPGFAAASELDWLAAMVALPTPAGLSAERRRELIRDAVAFQGRRGTPASLRALIELWTGARPRLVELYRERRIWSLDDGGPSGGGLGFGTVLPPLDPEGFLVASDPPAQQQDCTIEIGTATVGTANPAESADFGASLFAPEAHRFLVMLRAHELHGAGALDAVRAIVDREKPAHTAYELCVIEPLMRVGLQARVGVDTLVAGPPEAAQLDVAFNNSSAVFAALPGSAGRVGDAAVGRTTVLG